MNADYTYDRDTDQFVVTLDDGTEVCRTRAPHTGMSKILAAYVAGEINAGVMQKDESGMWAIHALPGRPISKLDSGAFQGLLKGVREGDVVFNGLETLAA